MDFSTKRTVLNKKVYVFIAILSKLSYHIWKF